MTGAEINKNGDSGLVPTPTIADKDNFLKGDGTWGTPTPYTLPTASDTTLGGVKIGSGLSITNEGELSTNIPVMTGATSSANGTSGLVP